MPKYLISHTVDHPRFTAGKVYEVVGREKPTIAYIVDDAGQRAPVAHENKFGLNCETHKGNGAWKWCDKEGNEL